MTLWGDHFEMKPEIGWISKYISTSTLEREIDGNKCNSNDTFSHGESSETFSGIIMLTNEL